MNVRKRIDASKLNLSEKVISINRVSKVVKGGKNLRFGAVVVVGDGEGHVGAGIGKAKEVPEAIRKAASQGKKDLMEVHRAGATIPHEVIIELGASKVLLKPAAPGTGIIAGGGVRAVIEAAGIKDILTKSLGSNNPANIVRATLLGLSRLKDPKEELAKRKGVPASKGKETGQGG